MDGIIGEIRIFSGNWAPPGWLPCNGAELDKGRNPGLYAVIKNYYGSNGDKFNLPKLNGRAPISMAMGSEKYVIGYTGGAIAYRIDNIPKHNHRLFGANKTNATALPEKAMPANFNSREYYYATAPTASTLNPLSVIATGKETIGPTVNNEQPYIAMNFIICVEGFFPY